MKKELVIREVIISVLAFCGSFFLSHWLVGNHPNWSIAVMTITLGIFLALLFFLASEKAFEIIRKSKIWRAVCLFINNSIEKIKDSVSDFFGTLAVLLPFILFGISLAVENLKERRRCFWKKE